MNMYIPPVDNVSYYKYFYQIKNNRSFLKWLSGGFFIPSYLFWSRRENRVDVSMNKQQSKHSLIFVLEKMRNSSKLTKSWFNRNFELMATCTNQWWSRSMSMNRQSNTFFCSTLRLVHHTKLHCFNETIFSARRIFNCKHINFAISLVRFTLTALSSVHFKGLLRIYVIRYT